MQIARHVRFIAFVVFSVLLSPAFCSAAVILGDPPKAPKDVSGLPRRPGTRSVTGPFTVNTFSREDVRSFYNAVYNASEGVPMNSTANVSTCTPGTNSTAFKEAVLRRINWFRAMAGVPADVMFDAGNNAKCQQAAVMMSAADALDHFPAPGWPCHTADGADAADSSNLALGSRGADSIARYIKDSQGNNTSVGHRRWLIFPQTQVMGTGDVPEQGSLAPANSTWVFDGHFTDPRPVTRTPHVSWPPAGYVPHQVVYPRWSFGLPTSVNLGAATVTMRSNGIPVTVAYEPYETGYGENTLVWVPLGLNENDDSTVFPFNGTDTLYTVAVSNIVGAAQSYYIYTVALFDPGVPGADYFPPTISGPSQPVVGQNNFYTFTAVSTATSYEWRATLPGSFTFIDGAESGLGNFTVNTTAGYSVQDSSVKAAGTYSFHLAHLNTGSAPPEQTLTLNQIFVPRSNGTLTIKSRLGLSGSGEIAHVQISTDGGVGWHDIYSQIGTDDLGEGSFVSRSFPLGVFASRTVQLRFSYTYTPGLPFYAPQGGLAVGWYLDDILINNAEVWTVVATNSTATTNFTFNPSQATNYNLNVRAYIFTEFPLDWGPVKTVTATTNALPAPPVIVLGRPQVTGGQVRLDFTVNSGSSATFKLLQADQVSGPWSTNASATLTTIVPGSSYRFTTVVGPASRFYRVQAP